MIHHLSTIVKLLLFNLGACPHILFLADAILGPAPCSIPKEFSMWILTVKWWISFSFRINFFRESGWWNTQSRDLQEAYVLLGNINHEAGTSYTLLRGISRALHPYSCPGRGSEKLLEQMKKPLPPMISENHKRNCCYSKNHLNLKQVANPSRSLQQWGHISQPIWGCSFSSLDTFMKYLHP